MGRKELSPLIAVLTRLLAFLAIGPPGGGAGAGASASLWPETNPNYELLGESPCQGDELYRPVPALCATVLHSNVTQASTECFALCDRLARGMSRCMGVEVTKDGTCCLVDRDWTREERSRASKVLGGQTLDDSQQMFERYGSHLVRAEDDPRQLKLVAVPTACYRRRVDCSAAPNCTALHRYPCEWGKIPNTCDWCRPRYWTPGEMPRVAGNFACVRDPAATPPTLRIAFSTACLQSDNQDLYEGLQAGYVGVAFALKRAWETRAKVIGLPLEERESFSIELVGFTENWTKVATFAGGGTWEASQTSVMPGTMAMSGAPANAPLQIALQLRQTNPPGQQVHAVLGNSQSKDSEVELATAGGIYHTPVIGWIFPDPVFENYPYYVRANKAALDAGLAIAALFQRLGYTRIFVFEQVAAPRLASQIRTQYPVATVSTDGPDQSAQGPCDGSHAQCIKEIVRAWERLRAQDARIIAHEHGGETFENVLPLATDILGGKVLYLASGLSCDSVPLLDKMAESQQEGRGLDTFYETAGWQGPRCVTCSNVASEYLDSSVLDNKTDVAEWLYDPKNVPLHLAACPQFPTIRTFLACDYCDTTMTFFASPACWDFLGQFDSAYAHSMCVQADFSKDLAVSQVLHRYLMEVGDEDSSGNFTEDGIRAAQRLRESGMPESYLELYEPGGHLWELGLGLETDPRPVTWSAHWGDTQLMDDVGKDFFLDSIEDSLTDAILTLILGYNEFLKHGGDADDTAKVTWPSAKNPVSYGFFRYLLGVRFTGLTGLVEYLPTGSRNVLYNVYQMVRGHMQGCFSEAVLHNATGGLQDTVYRMRSVAAEWNFATAPVGLDLSGELVLDDSNLKGCDAFAPGAFAGKIALIRRGGCYFGTKALNAQASGAVAVVIWNHADDLPLFMTASNPALRTPAVNIGRADGNALAEALRAGLRVSVVLPGSTRCVDPTYSVTGGFEMYELSMTYNPGTGSLMMPSVPITYSDGTTTPPLQVHRPCAAGAAYNLSSRECEACSPGNYFSPASESCLPCPAGAFSSDPGSTACQLCGLGQFSNASSNVCTPCRVGEVAPVLGAPSCAACDPGRFWSEGSCRGCVPGKFQANKAATTCELCAPGSFVEETEKSACTACMPGSYQQAAGNTTCIQCNVTAYQPKRSSVDCAPCEAVIAGSVAPGFGTSSPSMCQCPAGRFLSRTEVGAPGRCVPCLDVLTCPGGLTAEGACCEPPTQNARLHIGRPEFAGGPFPFITLCSDSTKCPAGRALGECPPHAVGRACDYCEEGYSYSRSAGSCISCAGQRTFWPLLVTCLVAVFMLFMMVLYASKEISVQSQTVMTIALTLSLSVNVLQVLGAFRELRVDWPEPLRSLFAILQVFTFNVDLIGPACVFGHDSPFVTYLGALLVHPTFALVLSLIFLVLAHLPRRCRRRTTIPQVANAQGLVLLSIYISVSIVAVKPWQCERNPDGSSSVVSYRVVECWSPRGLHSTLLGLSAVGILIYDITFFTIVAWATYLYPVRITQPGGIDFLQYFRFLFNRFKPKCYWYGLLYCLRNVLLALIPVALVNEVALQLLTTSALIMTTALIQCWTRPWRTELPNYIDAASAVGLMLLLVGGAALMDNGRDSSKAVVPCFFTAVLSLVTFIFVLTVLYSSYYFIRPRKPYGIFLSHHKVGAAVLARWFKLQLSTMTKDAIFYDSDNLSCLDELFEICAHQCKNLVVLLTRETLRRIWCAGEVVSAFQFNVNMILVACNDYVPPADDFVDGLEKEWSDLQKAEVARLGIRMEHIKEAYSGLKSRPSINLDRDATLARQAQTVEEVFSKCTGLRYTAGALMGTTSTNRTQSDAGGVLVITAAVVMYAEAKEPEDRMVGAVIVIMLQQQLGVTVHLVEVAETAYDSRFKSAQYLMVLLTRDVLASPAAGALLVKAAQRRNMALLPVTFDPAFTFPGADWYDSLVSGKVYSKDDLRLRGSPLAKVGQAYLRLFSVLSLRFTPHGSEKLQRTEVSAMVVRFSLRTQSGSRSKVVEEEAGADMWAGSLSMSFRATDQGVGSKTPRVLGAELAPEPIYNL